MDVLENNDEDNDKAIGVDIILMSIVYRSAAFISVICAICLAMETYLLIGKEDRHRITVTYRVLFVISCIQVMMFLANVIGSSAAPIDTYMAWGAIGNKATCLLQALDIYLFFPCGIFWDAILSWTYVAMVKYNWPTNKLRRLYWIGHITIWPIGICLAIVPIPFNSYGYTYQSQNCALIDCVGDDCEQTTIQFVSIYRGIVAFLSLLAILFCLICMIMLYLHVRHLEHKNRRYYSGMLTRTREMRRSKKVGIQGVLYSSTYVIVYLPFQIILGSASGPGTINYILHLLGGGMVNAFSLFYLLLFIRERQEMQTSLGRFLRKILCDYCCILIYPCKILMTYCCCCCCWGTIDKVEETAAVSHQSVIEQLRGSKDSKNTTNELTKEYEHTKEFESGLMEPQSAESDTDKA